MQHFDFHWEAPEYEHRPKDILWYWTSIIIALLMVGVTIWQRNYLFAIFIAVAEVLLIVWADRPPHIVRFTFDERGFHVSGSDHDERRHFYPYNHIKGFTIVNHGHEEWSDLILHLHERMRPHLTLHFPRAERARFEAVLRPLLPELRHDEPLVETIERFLGF